MMSLSQGHSKDKSSSTTTTHSAAAEPSAAHSHDAFATGEEGGASDNVTIYNDFDEMPLSQSLLRGIYSHGFEKPSAIQQRAIVPILQGGDVIGQAHAGTGKTGAFSIGLLQRLDFRCFNSAPSSSRDTAPQRVQGLVLCPTRELAQQNFEVISAIGDYLSGGASFCQMFVGGTRTSDDIKRLQTAQTTVAVGTPGRIGDLIKRGAFRTDAIKTIVLDEADEMLSQGFTEQVYSIFKYLPKDVQVVLISATMPDDVLTLAQKFMRTPTKILLKKDKLTLKDVKQYYVAIEDQQKLECLLDLYERLSVAQSVVFANTRQKVDFISKHMNAQNHTVSSIHAEMERDERLKVMSQFRGGSSRVLVTTDLVARGIDVQHVNIVVNYDLPTSVENYIHRIGRSGRFGKKGLAINLVSQRQLAAMREIESHYKIEIEELPMDFDKDLA